MQRVNNNNERTNMNRLQLEASYPVLISTIHGLIRISGITSQNVCIGPETLHIIRDVLKAQHERVLDLTDKVSVLREAAQKADENRPASDEPPASDKSTITCRCGATHHSRIVKCPACSPEQTDEAEATRPAPDQLLLERMRKEVENYLGPVLTRHRERMDGFGKRLDGLIADYNGDCKTNAQTRERVTEIEQFIEAQNNEANRFLKAKAGDYKPTL